MKQHNTTNTTPVAQWLKEQSDKNAFDRLPQKLADMQIRVMATRRHISYLFLVHGIMAAALLYLMFVTLTHCIP